MYSDGQKHEYLCLLFLTVCAAGQVFRLVLVVIDERKVLVLALAIVSKAAMNKWVHISLQILFKIFSGRYPEEG